MKQIILTIMALLAVAGGARDRLYIEDFTIQPGTTLDVPIVLENDTVYSAMQTDLYLPEGLEVETDYGEYWIDPTSRLSNNHFISSYRQPDGAIRIFVSSQSVRLFTGNCGPLVTVRIRAAASFAGRKTVSLRRSVLVEENGDRHTPNDCTAQATAEGSAVVTGDVTGDGRVDIADVNAVINMMLGKATQTATGDVSGDGLVDIADVNRIINIMLGKN
ncbi:MAG: dockerin type I repeat-containing protein [Muribaculaceae bacterium]|nr:dockerin type I repeat-containing protein [Muribaculaceae bacterium]